MQDCFLKNVMYVTKLKQIGLPIYFGCVPFGQWLIIYGRGNYVNC
ncbi:hypothetical protein CGSHiR3021_00942 [Haemophilus influenzae 22.4-21]|uniref:Uncharacterized protein n=1 Tax=Haemophilus influenzae 22.4-21 TaxID=375063 RepID=A4P168_HAEIF|nr:hypothetical protein CGSHiR3021_00942 [Haemophilus influenzae 22.4-21]